MQFVNLTPHEITVRVAGKERVIRASGKTVRIETSSVRVTECDATPIYETTTGEVLGLPERQLDRIYIVSMPVAQAICRDDVVAPDTGPTAVRDDEGQIIAVQQFTRYRRRQ